MMTLRSRSSSLQSTTTCTVTKLHSCPLLSRPQNPKTPKKFTPPPSFEEESTQPKYTETKLSCPQNSGHLFPSSPACITPPLLLPCPTLVFAAKLPHLRACKATHVEDATMHPCRSVTDASIPLIYVHVCMSVHVDVRMNTSVQVCLSL